MKKYIIHIGKNNKEESKKVQEKLFALGYHWSEGTKVLHTDAKFIYLNDNPVSEHRLMVSYNGIFKDYIKEGYILLTPEYVLEYGETLERAVKKPETKKMTVAEIAKILGHNVEIIEE